MLYTGLMRLLYLEDVPPAMASRPAVVAPFASSSSGLESRPVGKLPLQFHESPADLVSQGGLPLLDDGLAVAAAGQPAAAPSRGYRSTAPDAVH